MRAQRVAWRQVAFFLAQHEETVFQLVQTQVMGLSFVVVYPNPAVVVAVVVAAVVVVVIVAVVVIAVVVVVVIVAAVVDIVVVVVVIAVVGENPFVF